MKKTDYMMIAMKVIQLFEGLRLEAYKPLKGDKLTIGFGSTIWALGKKKITLARAYELLIRDMVKFDRGIDKLVRVELNPYQRAAILSLLYNVGIKSFKYSRALRYLNSGDLESFKIEAFDKDHGWVYDGGKVIRGLVIRRAKEQVLFEHKK